MGSNEFAIEIKDFTLLDLLTLMLNRAQSPDDPLFIACHAELDQRFNRVALHPLQSDESGQQIAAGFEEALEEFPEPTEEEWAEADEEYDHDQAEVSDLDDWRDPREFDEEIIPQYQPVFYPSEELAPRLPIQPGPVAVPTAAIAAAKPEPSPSPPTKPLKIKADPNPDQGQLF